MFKEKLNQAVEFVKANPVKTAAIAAGVVVVGVVAVKAIQYAGAEVTEELATEVAEEVVEAMAS